MGRAWVAMLVTGQRRPLWGMNSDIRGAAGRGSREHIGWRWEPVLSGEGQHRGQGAAARGQTDGQPGRAMATLVGMPQVREELVKSPGHQADCSDQGGMEPQALAGPSESVHKVC